ncbi:uncharacterized protein [Zea mays]|jgi:hypothetical protein|uniref:Uncharacterized protein n=1 Tax=Zea mays TaxID=4577 RepID=A0A1D6NVH0_MAIZE|nr:uncharacterized protein LOC103638086 [Zea mays]AQL02122.1 hypothetical protein ZEAMMB73_Zm00001d045355 [Zea mays]|eukprot:XP_008659298.1 uncharacterized protein LOC103638086 [Zea mays]
MLARVVDRRASAIRRFPPGCGRPHKPAAGPPPYHRIPTAAAAKTKHTLPNPSARAATNTAPPPPRQTLSATASLGAEAPDRGVGSGRNAAAVVTVRLVSAVRGYPPGCGRGVAVSKSKPPDSEDEAEREDGAGNPSAVVGNGDPKARACDGDVMLRASALDHAEFSSNGGVTTGGDGDAGAHDEGGGKPWEVTGLMAAPFLPWARHERRSQRGSGGRP